MPTIQTATSHVIKQVPQSDLMSVVDLWAFAFDIPSADPLLGKESIRERIREFCQNGLAYLVGAYDGNKLSAVSAIIDFDMHLADRWVKCGGIAGVATYPEYRRQRLVRSLIADCLQRLHEQKVPLAALWPFSYSFYERLGWTVSDMRHQVEVSLAPLRTGGGDSSAYRAGGHDNFKQAMELHERWSEHLNLSLRRSAYRWQKMFADPRFRYRLFMHEDGYMLWNFGQSENRCLNVSEWCYLSEAAFKDGLALIGQMDSQYDRARLALPELETVLRALGLACEPEIRVVPGMMSRVVNLEAFLDCLPDHHKKEVEVLDPLGITAPAKDGSVLDRGPGALVQHVTSFWKTPNLNFPASLYGIAAQYPPYSVERY